MIKNYKGTLILTSIVLLIPMLVGLLLWDRLPEQIPSHWDIHGNVDSWSSKAGAVFGFPALLLGVHWACVFASTADPKRKNYNPKMFQFVLWICPLLSLLLHSLVYAAAIGYDISIELIMPLLVGATFVIIGNLLPKCPQTYTLGIKLPWTLASEENWNKTHRMAGKLWVVGGILLMATAFWASFWLLIAVLIAMVIVPTVYSYLLFRKSEKESNNET